MPSQPTDAAIPAAPPYRFLIEVLLFLSYFVFGLSWIGYAPFLKDFREAMRLTYSDASLIISSVSFAKIFVPFVAGALAVRMGVKNALLLGMALICTSLWSPFAGSFPALLASRFLFGVGGAIVVTLFGAAILQWFPARERPLVNGINGVAVNSGITLSLYITVPLAESFGRNRTLFAFGMVSLVIALAWAVLGKNLVVESATASGASGASFRSVLATKETWYLALGFAGPLSIYLVFNTWLPSFYQQTLGMNAAQASRLTGLANLVGIPAAIIGGILAKRFPKRKPLIWGSALVMTTSAFGLFLPASVPLLTASAVIYGISVFLWVSPLVTLAMELPGMTPARFGMVMGVFYGVSYIIAFFAPMLTGALRDATGTFVPGFVLFALSSLTLAVSGWLLPETGKKS